MPQVPQPHGKVATQRREVQAVRGVNLTVGNGELSGLLGPNGAGHPPTAAPTRLTMKLSPPSSACRGNNFRTDR